LAKEEKNLYFTIARRLTGFQLCVSGFGRINIEWIMKYVRKEKRMPVCLECGDKIKHGRSDKKFCCEDCKNRHNNKMAKFSRANRRKVMAMLTRNYAILEQLIRSGIKSAEITDLISEGFVPDCVTGFHKNRFQSDEFSCFDIKYKMTDSRVYSISKIRNVSLNLQVDMEKS
jgi:hypothetical protein